MFYHHELDTPSTYVNRELDISGFIGETYLGRRAAEDIKRWLKANRRKLPSDATYLALGAGQAYQEVYLARRLKIPPPQTTLLDREISPFTRERLETKFNGVHFIESGIFAYLTHPPARTFSLISALGIEYVFYRPGAPETFASAIPDLLNEGGIVYINSYVGKNVDHLWKKNRFEVIRGYTPPWSPQMYVYRGKK